MGGKYVVAYNGSFEFDDGIIVPYEYGEVIPSYEEEGIPALNVDLNSEAFN